MIGCAHRHMTHIARVRAPHLSGACVVCAVRIRGTPEEHPSPPLSDSPAPLSIYSRRSSTGHRGVSQRTEIRDLDASSGG